MKKILVRIVVVLVTVVLLAMILAYATGNAHLIKGVSSTYLRGYNTSHIYDLDYFDSREVKNGEAQPWKESPKLGKLSLSNEEEKLHEEFRSVAYLVFKNDEVIFEKYWGEHNEKAVSNSFSMVKSLTGILTGIAHDEGLIKSLDDLVCDYLPELCTVSDKNADITIRDLLTMTSTINFDESYGDPFGFMARTTYGSDLEAVVYDNYFAEKEPGSEWKYLGGNTLLLGFIVEKVSGKTLSQYTSEKIWSKIGAEYSAQWALDEENGQEKSYCCFNATARDFARLGKLILQRGKWNNQQVVSEAFIDSMITPINVPDATGELADHYGYQIWLDKQEGERIVNYRGMLGQYISVIPNRDLIIVRLGHKRGIKDHHCPSDLQQWIKMGKRLSEEV